MSSVQRLLMTAKATRPLPPCTVTYPSAWKRLRR